MRPKCKLQFVRSILSHRTHVFPVKSEDLDAWTNCKLQFLTSANLTFCLCPGPAFLEAMFSLVLKHQQTVAK